MLVVEQVVMAVCVTGEAVGDPGGEQRACGPVPPHHAPHQRPQEPRHEATPLGPDTGAHYT
jgi:hypothetical protein